MLRYSLWISFHILYKTIWDNLTANQSFKYIASWELHTIYWCLKNKSDDHENLSRVSELSPSFHLLLMLQVHSWTCLEPDFELSLRAKKGNKIRNHWILSLLLRLTWYYASAKCEKTLHPSKGKGFSAIGTATPTVVSQASVSRCNDVKPQDVLY